MLLASHRQPPDWFLVSRSRPARHQHTTSGRLQRPGGHRSGDRGPGASTVCAVYGVCVRCVRCVCAVLCAVCGVVACCAARVWLTLAVVLVLPVLVL